MKQHPRWRDTLREKWAGGAPVDWEHHGSDARLIAVNLRLLAAAIMVASGRGEEFTPEGGL